MSKETLQKLIWQQQLTIRSLSKDRDDIQDKIDRLEFALECNLETLESGECDEH